MANYNVNKYTFDNNNYLLEDNRLSDDDITRLSNVAANAASIAIDNWDGNGAQNISSLVINKLTQAQYNTISSPSNSQLYFITDDTIYAEKSYVDNLFANVDALPSQSGNSGKYLTTNGTTASWTTLDLSNYLKKVGTNTPYTITTDLTEAPLSIVVGDTSSNSNSEISLKFRDKDDVSNGNYYSGVYLDIDAATGESNSVSFDAYDTIIGKMWGTDGAQITVTPQGGPEEEGEIYINAEDIYVNGTPWGRFPASFITSGTLNAARIPALNYISKITSTDNTVVRFDGTTGAVQNSNVTIDDTGNINAPYDNNFLSHGNEFNFIPTITANTEVHINHRQRGSNGAGRITQYHFKDGAGGLLATISSGQFSGNAATATSATSATTAAYLISANANPTYGVDRLEYFNAGLAAGAAANTTGSPTQDWYYHLRMNAANSGGYYVDIAPCFFNDNIYWKRVSNGSVSNNKWMHIWVEGNAVTSAVWNDYAEYRETDTQEFGRCVIENGDDTMSLSTRRLQKGCSITSDTWGFAQGQTEKAKTPIAVSGRVLAYPFEDKEEFKKHIGDAVCSGPEGTVSIMTDEEVQKYPLSIIGTISAVPDYEEWGGGSDRDPVKVNGRVWIRIK